MRLLATAILVTAAASVHTAPLATVEGQPQTGLREIPLVIRTADGGVHRYRVEVAETAQQQATGMMFRTEMPRDHGMLFPMRPARVATFYMRNTLVPLDIIFIATDNRVLNIGAGKPLDESIVASDGEAAAVLELNAGEAQRIGLQPGDHIGW
ncbi:MAG: DUF192 domain-containing protein [Sphingomonadaceae bacterium]